MSPILLTDGFQKSEELGVGVSIVEEYESSTEPGASKEDLVLQLAWYYKLRIKNRRYLEIFKSSP